jgi:hypothetical protein
LTRRRKLPPPDTAAVPAGGLVICTDHDRHRPLRIAVFDYDPEPGEGSKVTFSQTSRWDLIADEMRPGTPFTFRFKCKLCRRDVRLTEANAAAAIDALRQAFGGNEPFDISLLAC